MGNVGMLKILKENTDVLASSATYIMHQREEVKKKYLESSVNDCMLTSLFI
jgi:hypothetical protein